MPWNNVFFYQQELAEHLGSCGLCVGGLGSDMRPGQGTIHYIYMIRMRKERQMQKQRTHQRGTNLSKKKLRDAAMEIREKRLPCAESPAAVNLDRTGLPCFLLLRAGRRSGCCCSCCCSPSPLCCLPSNLSPSNVQKQMGGSCKLVFLLLHVPARGTLHLQQVHTLGV